MSQDDAIEVFKRIAIDPSNLHFVSVGYSYGYPMCCIMDFVDNKSQPGALRNTPGNVSGFIPCPKHRKMILDGKCKIEDLIHEERRLDGLKKFQPEYLPVK